MAGYMTKMHGNIYQGEFVNGETTGVANGALVVLNTADGKTTMKLAAADTTTKFMAMEKTTIYDGIPAVRFIVTAVGKPTYFVENGFEYSECDEFDTTKYETAPGKFLRAHPLLVGDEFVIATALNATVGTEYSVKANGTIA